MLERKYCKDAENVQIILELGCRNESLLLSNALCLSEEEGVVVQDSIRYWKTNIVKMLKMFRSFWN